MILCAIVATDKKNAIGKNNQLLWHLPADLKFFKNTTMGCPIIMGRKTFESIGRLLPGRENIIISRTNLTINGAVCFTSINDALNYCEKFNKVFIIGGAEIYNQTLPLITELYKTVVNAEFEADAFFPVTTNFKRVWHQCHDEDDKNKFNYCFEKWERI
ncbi:MAG: dihydrofolate reductase [Bacteroidia bacterium]